MFLKIFIGIILIGALFVGIASMFLRTDQILYLIRFKDFFDFSVMILAFGALVKYLCTWPKK